MPPFAAETARARAVQSAWAELPVRDRLRPVREARHLFVERADALAAAAEADVGRRPDELVATDLLPTAAAAKFLERSAARLLAPRRVRGRPLWLAGCRDVVHRRPHGVVGVIGTWNYPVFLNAVPILHALVAGNAVLWKPSEQAPRTTGGLADLIAAAGFPADLFGVLPATREAGPELAEADVDFLHFTGSEPVGRRLAARLGERLVPSVLELSGHDAAFVLADADLRLAARCCWYATTLNAGRTCMAVRRAFVAEEVAERFVAELTPLAEKGEGRIVLNPDPSGEKATTGFAPVLEVTPVPDVDAALQLHALSPFRLTAAVFTADARAAARLADRLPVGSVVVNDAIAPTAHPATPFGGRGASGWGVTQGEEGLLAMTVPQVRTTRRGTFRPHVDALLSPTPAAGLVPRGLLALTHGRRLRDRLRGLRDLVRGVRGG